MKTVIKCVVALIVSCSFLSCEKEKVEVEEIDLSKVNVEVEFECIREEHDGRDYVYTILCTGKIGGFNGSAYIEISHDYHTYINEGIVVAGDYTSFSFAFTLRSSTGYYNEPFDIDVCIRKPASDYYQTLFESSAVIIL